MGYDGKITENEISSTLGNRLDNLQTAINGKEPAITKNTGFNLSLETTATNIKMNGTRSVGSLSTIARSDHVHPVDTSRASSSHTHGSITNDGKIGSTANLPIITGVGGTLQTGSFGTTTGTFL